jgi:Arc/MetJ-type ribon-helix-helix transcriptional regulator
MPTCYALSVASISFRSDEGSDAALRELTADGSDRSAVIRQALTEAAARRRAERLRAQAEALADDPDDLAEMRRVQTEMGALRAW